MEKKELAQKLADENQIPAADAADELDTALHHLVRNLRNHERLRPSALQRLMEEAGYTADPKKRHART